MGFSRVTLIQVPHMIRFDQDPRVFKLKDLAENAPDLTTGDFLTDQRLTEKTCRAAGWTLHWGAQRVDASIEGELVEFARARSAVEAMRQMQGGAIVNTIEGVACENRPALHTALRAQSALGQERAETARRKARAEIEKTAKLLESLGEAFSHLIVVGIGGSELGPKALYLALRAFEKPHRQIRFISSLDPDEIHLALADCPLAKALVICISKSGTTLETQTNETILREHWRAAGLPEREHFVSIGMPGTPLDDERRFRTRLYLEDNVGGRMSATSVIGALIIGFTVGLPAFEEILRGAAEMDAAALEPDPRRNLPLWLALLGIWNRNFLGHCSLAVIPYSQALARLSAHLQQLDMESNGKGVDKSGQPVNFETGPLIWGEPGSNAQHSIGQWLHQSSTTAPVEFIGFLKPQRGPDSVQGGTSSQEKLLCNLFAQSLALAGGQKSENPNRDFAGNRPNSVLLAEQLTPKVLGALWALYEHKVAFQGFLWNINSFDQEGVQLGKVLATELIRAAGERRAGRDGGASLGRAYIAQLP